MCDREYIENDEADSAAAAASGVSCAVCVLDGRVLSGSSDAGLSPGGVLGAESGVDALTERER